MGEILGPIVRIALRYLAGVFVAKGYAASPDTFADPDLVQIVCYGAGGVCAAISEGWWVLARKMGWST